MAGRLAIGTLQEDLRATSEELRETHISWVFLSGANVWKVKKPVNLGFLDFSTLEARREACEAEVTLNRRFSPTVYRGVVPVTRDASGLHRIGGRGEIVDWAVHMRRLPDTWRGDLRLDAGQLGEKQVEAIALEIADFHASARADEETARFGSPAAIAVNVRENFAQTRGAVDAFVTPAQAAEIEAWQLAVLERQEPLFEARVAAGRVRDGHGDLRLEQLYVDDGGDVHLLDCIEFNERFRYGDVCSDVAFLAMDLASRGRVDLAELFLAAYARASNDYDLYSLVDFYQSYRAYVRAKIATIVVASASAPAGQSGGPSGEPSRRPSADAARAAAEARRFYLLALAAERRSLIPPLVVAVGGVIASGKSTVADRLASALGAPVVDSDRTRKHLVGVESTTKLHDGAWSGAYDLDFTDRVYDEVFRRADVVLASGRPVVIDASFRPASLRARARALAERHGVPFRLVECRASAEVCKARLREREKQSTVSDGRLEIFDDFAARWEPVTELPRAEHIVLDTERPMGDNLSTLRERLPTWPAGLTG